MKAAGVEGFHHWDEEKDSPSPGFLINSKGGYPVRKFEKARQGLARDWLTDGKNDARGLPSEPDDVFFEVFMKEFEYDVTLHPTETFEQVALFCTSEGECNMERVPADQMGALKSLLNERGRSGWELVQVSFGEGGLMAIWKRESTGTVIQG